MPSEQVSPCGRGKGLWDKDETKTPWARGRVLGYSLFRFNPGCGWSRKDQAGFKAALSRRGRHSLQTANRSCHNRPTGDRLR